MTTSPAESPADEIVLIRFKETGAIGNCATAAVPYYEARGYVRVSDKEAADLARAADPLVAFAPASFDPSAEGVSAKKVADYLTTLDTATPQGQAEYDRVVAAEKAGGNRSSALPSA